LGQKGQGKTTLAKKILNNIERGFVFDVLGEYNGLGETVINTRHLIKTIEKILILKKTNWKLILKITNDTFLFDSAEIIWKFANFYKQYADLDFWIFMEECSMYMPNNSNNIFFNFIKYGRHFKINQVYISRNTAEISKQILSQADLIVSFKQIEPRHKETLEKYGFDVERLDKLEKFNYITVGDKKILDVILNKNNKTKIKNEVKNERH